MWPSATPVSYSSRLAASIIGGWASSRSRRRQGSGSRVGKISRRNQPIRSSSCGDRICPIVNSSTVSDSMNTGPHSAVAFSGPYETLGRPVRSCGSRMCAITYASHARVRSGSRWEPRRSTQGWPRFCIVILGGAGVPGSRPCAVSLPLPGQAPRPCHPGGPSAGPRTRASPVPARNSDFVPTTCRDLCFTLLSVAWMLHASPSD